MKVALSSSTETARIGGFERDGLSPVPIGTGDSDGGYPADNTDTKVCIAAVSPVHLGIGVVRIRDVIIQVNGGEALTSLIV